MNILHLDPNKILHPLSIQWETDCLIYAKSSSERSLVRWIHILHHLNCQITMLEAHDKFYENVECWSQILIYEDYTLKTRERRHEDYLNKFSTSILRKVWPIDRRLRPIRLLDWPEIIMRLIGERTIFTEYSIRTGNESARSRGNN